MSSIYEEVGQMEYGIKIVGDVKGMNKAERYIIKSLTFDDYFKKFHGSGKVFWTCEKREARVFESDDVLGDVVSKLTDDIKIVRVG